MTATQDYISRVYPKDNTRFAKLITINISSLSYVPSPSFIPHQGFEWVHKPDTIIKYAPRARASQTGIISAGIPSVTIHTNHDEVALGNTKQLEEDASRKSALYVTTGRKGAKEARRVTYAKHMAKSVILIWAPLSPVSAYIKLHWLEFRCSKRVSRNMESMFTVLVEVTDFVLPL